MNIASSFEPLKKHVTKVFYGAFGLLLLLLSILFLALSLLIGLNAIVSFVIALVITVIAALVVTHRIQNSILEPLAVIKQAVDHVEADKSTKPAPDLSQVKYARDFVTETVSQIYNLASMAQGLTADIQAKKAFFRKTINYVPIGIFTLNAEDKLTFANKVGRTLLDVDYETAIGKKTVYELLNLNYDGISTVKEWLAMCKEEKIQETNVWERVTLTRANHDVNKVDLAAYYSKNSSEGVETILVVFDKTDIYSYDETEVDYIALAAHEIRGPVTVIRGYLDVLKQEMEGRDVEKIEVIGKIKASADRLAGYVNNIMKIARVDQGTMKIHPEESDWATTIKELAEEMSIKAESMNKTITLNLPADLPAVAVDTVAISEVLINLTDNALKYGSDEDNVVITVYEKDGTVETTVEDHGNGIPAVVMDKLFSKFYRSHRSRQEIAGTGIGLFVCKAIVEAHEGQIWVRSKEGQGTTFGFNVPTYDAAVQSELDTDNAHPEIKRSKSGWIKNHSMTRR